MSFPEDYTERVYAGVLGKIIGVYLGRPFEGWSYERIMTELGEVWYYVHEKRGMPLIVTDDDISGTFTFLRALPDYGNSPDLTPAQIGQTWLNYIIENRAILWWGGMSNSTEHTAFLRLQSGIPAPRSGSIGLNGQTVAEQIGAQIFIDGWGMICPGDPERGADFARRAAGVSHDGEAIYGAQVVAAMEAQAFVEPDMNALLDTATSLIPRNSIIYRLIADLREWHDAEPDWRKTREKIVAQYGYDKYGGNCHIVPNHALIIHALLHGNGDFQKSLMIVNTCGWDTDCNSGNVGCLLGIRNGLEGIADGPDWLGPVADRMYLPTADGGRCITDAVQETYRIVNSARALQGEESLAPKNGARFHFSLPGSVQGFQPEDSPECRGVGHVYQDLQASGPGTDQQPVLVISCTHLAQGRACRVATPTFITPEGAKMGGYSLIACPTLYSGQTVRAGFVASEANSRSVDVCLYISVYDKEDVLQQICGPVTTMKPGQEATFVWEAPDTDGKPIAEIGLQIASAKRADATLDLQWLTWDGTPKFRLERPLGKMAKQQWANGVDHFETPDGEGFRLIQNRGVGLIIHGTREWTDYEVTSAITPHSVKSCGLAARVQGLKRYYALLLGSDNKARLVKALDGKAVLAEMDFPLQVGRQYGLRLRVTGNRIQASMDDAVVFDVQDVERPLLEGAIGLVCEEGRMAAQWVKVQP